MEKTETVKVEPFFPKSKWIVPRKYIVPSKPLCDREFQKLKLWVMKGDIVEYALGTDKKIWVFNRTRIDAYKRRKESRE